jgi:hypothetical protein
MPQIKQFILITTTVLAILVVYNAYFIVSETLIALGNIVYYLAIIMGIIIAVVFYLLKKKEMLVFPLFFLLAVLPSKIIVNKGIDMQQQSAMTNGNKIIAALVLYQAKYKALPEKLSELEPNFIAKLPHYYLGLDPNHYIYEKRDAQNYNLSFFTAGVNSYSWSQENGKWFSHD